MERGTKTSYLLLLSFVIYLAVNYILILSASETTLIVALQFLGLAIFVLLILSLLVNIITYYKKRRPMDIWKLGFIGLLGLVGFLPGFGQGFFGLYGFYGFFGLKNSGTKVKKLK